MAALVALVTVVAACGLVLSQRGGADPELSPVLEAATRPPSTAPEVAPLTLDGVPMPTPEAPPDDPYADVPIERLGTLEIPAIGLTHDVFEGVWLTVLNHGPGHWPGTALPGERGNTVFPGHRTTYSHPFLDLDLLEPGDQVIFRMPDGVHTYEVREVLVVDPKDLWVVDQTSEPTFTLVACHPKGSARQRIVVKGDLVRSEPSLGVAAGATTLAGVAATLPL